MQIPIEVAGITLMKIAVTGATGFVGRELLTRLQQAGHKVVPIVRRKTGFSNEVIAGGLETADISALADGMHGVDAIAHLAALTHVRGHPANAQQAFQRVNVQGTQRLLHAAAAAGIKRVVYMSSIKVNGEETCFDHRFSGHDTPAPEDDYGRTKYDAELLIANEAVGAGIQTVILRPPMVYGSGVAGNFGRLVSAIQRGIPLPFRLVNNRRSLISVCNLADATICALTRADAAGMVLTVSDGEDFSTPALVEAIGFAVGRPARLIPVPVAALKLAGQLLGRGDEIRRIVGNLQIDNEAACVALGWTPQDHLQPALMRMLRPPK